MSKRRAPRTIQEFLDGPPAVSQQTLAHRLGCHQSMVSMLVSGRRRPGGKLALALHAQTGVPLTTLLGTSRRRANRPPPAATGSLHAQHDSDDDDSDHGSADLVY